MIKITLHSIDGGVLVMVNTMGWDALKKLPALNSFQSKKYN